MTRFHKTFWIAIIAALAMGDRASAATPDPLIQAGFHSMYALDFAAAERQFSDYVRQRPEDPIGYDAQAACVFFTELDRLHVLDAEFYVDDKKLYAEPAGTPNPEAKLRLFELTRRARQFADDLLRRDSKSEDALFALALANGLESDYTFLVEKSRLAAAKPGRAGFENAKRLLEVNPEFYDAYIWTGVTNYVVASLPLPLRWLAKLRGYSGNKQTAVSDLRLAAEKGSLLKPYAKILLAVTYLREKNKTAAQAVVAELSAEFPTNPLFAKHVRRLSAH